VLIALTTVELIRRRKLREEYALLWLAASGVLLVFAAFPRLLWHISNALGLFYLTTTVLICFGFLSLMVLHLAMVVSRSADDSRQVAQRLALLEHRVEELGGSPLPPADDKPQQPKTPPQPRGQRD